MGINDAEKGTCTTIFMLPAIGVAYNDLLQYGFINAYIDDLGYIDRGSNKVYLLFKPEIVAPLEGWIKKQLKNRGSIVDDYDYAGGYVVTAHAIPDKYVKEYELFLEGKYSKFSDTYKALFPEFVSIKLGNGKMAKELSLQGHIFQRSKAIRDYWENKIGVKLDHDAEMWSKPDTTGFETLNIENI